MKDKEIIEEFARKLVSTRGTVYETCYKTKCNNCKFKAYKDGDSGFLCRDLWLATSFIKNSVVLSRGEYKRLLDNAIRVDMEYLDHERAKERKETAEKIMALRGYITKQFHKHHEARDIAENEYKKCKEEMGKAVLNNDWHRCDAIMFILEDIATEFDKLIKSLGAE